MEERHNVYATPLALSTKIPPGLTKAVADRLKVSVSGVRKVWTAYKKGKQADPERSTEDVLSRKKRTGRHRKEISLTPLKSNGVPHTVRDAARILTVHNQEHGGPRVTKDDVQRLKKEGFLLVCKQRERPHLEPKNMAARLEFVRQFFVPHGVCEALDDCIHLDEKWYTPDVKNGRILYVKGTEPQRYLPVRRGHESKIKGQHIVAVARPRVWMQGGRKEIFDGKMLCHACVEDKVAKKTTKNRKKGTIEKVQHTVDGEFFFNVLVNELLPAIEEKWPKDWDKQRPIRVWMDNAGVHKRLVTGSLRKKWMKAEANWRRHTGLKIVLFLQPAYSPDLNVLDLGLFRSLNRNRSTGIRLKSLSDLADNIHNAYDKWDPDAIARCWRTLMNNMVAIMEHNGGNFFQTPHSKKTLSTDMDYGVPVVEYDLLQRAKAKEMELLLQSTELYHFVAYSDTMDARSIRRSSDRLSRGGNEDGRFFDSHKPYSRFQAIDVRTPIPLPGVMSMDLSESDWNGVETRLKHLVNIANEFKQYLETLRSSVHPPGPIERSRRKYIIEALMQDLLSIVNTASHLTTQPGEPKTKSSRKSPDCRSKPDLFTHNRGSSLKQEVMLPRAELVNMRRQLDKATEEMSSLRQLREELSENVEAIGKVKEELAVEKGLRQKGKLTASVLMQKNQKLSQSLSKDHSTGKNHAGQYKQAVEDSQKQLARKDEQIAILRADTQRLHNRVIDLEARISGDGIPSMTQNDELRAEIASLHNRVIEAEQTNAPLEATASRTRSRIRHQSQEERKKLIEELDDIKDRYMKEIARLKIERDNYREALQKAEATLAAVEQASVARVECLQSQLEDVQQRTASQVPPVAFDHCERATSPMFSAANIGISTSFVGQSHSCAVGMEAPHSHHQLAQSSFEPWRRCTTLDKELRASRLSCHELQSVIAARDIERDKLARDMSHQASKHQTGIAELRQSQEDREKELLREVQRLRDESHRNQDLATRADRHRKADNERHRNQITDLKQKLADSTIKNEHLQTFIRRIRSSYQEIYGNTDTSSSMLVWQ
eukprot:Clim_evm23s157 gene=Clim_evmTU23s157